MLVQVFRELLMMFMGADADDLNQRLVQWKNSMPKRTRYLIVLTVLVLYNVYNRNPPMAPAEFISNSTAFRLHAS